MSTRTIAMTLTWTVTASLLMGAEGGGCGLEKDPPEELCLLDCPFGLAVDEDGESRCECAPPETCAAPEGPYRSPDTGECSFLEDPCVVPAGWVLCETTCEYDGQQYAIGAQFPSIDEPCLGCRCDEDGSVRCDMFAASCANGCRELGESGCIAAPDCTWLYPGSMDPSQPTIAAPGCYPVEDCASNDECEVGEVCSTAWVYDGFYDPYINCVQMSIERQLCQPDDSTPM